MLDEFNFGDFADDITTQTELLTDGSDITGAIQSLNDRDVFRVQVETGQTYRITISSPDQISDISLSGS